MYYASLAGNHIARVHTEAGGAEVIEPPTAGQGARRSWADSRGRVWVSEWNSGQVSVYNPRANTWRAWRLPGSAPRAYAVYMDERDAVWLTDFAARTVVRFDPETETFTSFANSARPGNVRQLHGRSGEIWAPESATDRIMVIRY